MKYKKHTSKYMLLRDAPLVRTQISLPKQLKERIETYTRSENISLAEYLRIAAEEKLDKETIDIAYKKKILSDLRKAYEPQKHPEWATLESVIEWQHKIREDHSDRDLIIDKAFKEARKKSSVSKIEILKKNINKNSKKKL